MPGARSFCRRCVKHNDGSSVAVDPPIVALSLFWLLMIMQHPSTSRSDSCLVRNSEDFCLGNRKGRFRIGRAGESGWKKSFVIEASVGGTFVWAAERNRRRRKREPTEGCSYPIKPQAGRENGMGLDG